MRRVGGVTADKLQGLVTSSGQSFSDAMRGVSSKIFTGKPMGTAKNVGVIAFKRVRCVGTKCDVYKTGYCIKTPTERFSTTTDYGISDDEYKAFAGDVSAAFDNPGTHYATLKESYRCDTADQDKAGDWIFMC
jgi:hypothetical protein